jgi:glutaredoxin
MTKQLVVYVSPYCYNCTDTRQALKEWGVPATFIDVKRDGQAAARVRAWTGFESVPTLVIAEEGSLEPCEPPTDLGRGISPRGKDRQTMLTEPSRAELRAWLVKHELMA